MTQSRSPVLEANGSMGIVPPNKRSVFKAGCNASQSCETCYALAAIAKVSARIVPPSKNTLRTCEHTYLCYRLPFLQKQSAKGLKHGRKIISF
eukprot:5274871-Amphidinium_carterae.1